MQTEEGNGLSNYQVRRLSRFDKSYKALIKNHYRKDAKAKQEFEQMIEEYINQEVADNPCSNEVSDPEPFPAKTAELGFEFRKKKWRRLPGIQGAARFGRLMYIVYTPKRIVYLMWIYTHAEYQEPNSRPPDKDLKDEINLLKQEISTEVDDSLSE